MAELKAILQYINAHFLWFMLFAYGFSVVWPRLGLAIRDISFGTVTWFDGSLVRLSLPLIMLALLLFNAGLGIKTKELAALARKPGLLFVGLAANIVLPIAYIFMVSLTTIYGNEPPELQSILVGLALIAAMPIAASSTAWSQKSEGNMVLSLGLIAFSTILSPITTPFGLRAVGYMTTGVYSQTLFHLSQQGTSAFLTISVLIPTILGVLFHFIIGEGALARISVPIKFLNLTDLLLLSYSNASLVLPRIIAKPDWDFLSITLTVVGLMCCLAFLAGWVLMKLTHARKPEGASLMFGLGMNNNGTGLVLASTVLADFPLVMLPMILYNIVQQIVAGIVDAIMSRPRADGFENKHSRSV